MGVGPPYKGGSFPTCMSMRTRGTSTHAPPPPPASPRHASTRVAGMSRADVYIFATHDGYTKGHAGAETFSVVDTEFERRASSAAACSLRLPLLLHLLPQPLRVLLLCLYKRGRSSPERHTRSSSSSHHKVPSTALLLRSSPSRLAACTAGRDSSPPKPHLFESCTGER